MQNNWWRQLRLVLLAGLIGSFLWACGGGNDAPAPAVSSEATPTSLSLSRIGGFTHSGGIASAEITAYDPLSQRLFVINGALGTVDVLSLANPAAPVQVGTLTTAAFGPGLAGANSVAIFNGVVALAIEANPKTNNGVVVFVRASDLRFLALAPAGALPDMLTFTPDGRFVLVANEGEPNSYNLPDSIDPVGSISIIEVSGLSPTTTAVFTTVTSAGFESFNNQAATLRASGVRVFGPNASVAQDLEPEYIAVSADSRTAYVTLQENNAIAIVDIASRRVSAIRPLGFKDHNVAGFGLDPSDEDGGTNTNSGTSTIRIAPVPVRGMYQPDAIASFMVGTATFLVTANEGDARDYPGFNEEVRVRAHCTGGLAPTFANATNQLFDSGLGRLQITSTLNGGQGVLNASSQCTDLYAFGARSFSIWNSDISRVFDSGDQFEQRTAALSPGIVFNASNANNTFDNRSTSKGPEPEGVVTAVFGTRTFAFIGLERVGGVIVYDVSNPAAASFVTYINTRSGAAGTPIAGDNGAEGLTFIPASQSPNGRPLLVVGFETSGTTGIFQINLIN
ncbi:MAG: choice-of-anchor I family protein [Burkholderiales bacterium]